MKEENNYIKSPINYSGGKYRLLKQIMPLFPTNINTFVDLFCGAGTVGINVNANKIISNDYINYLPELFNTWKIKSLDDINQYIDKTIKENNLSPLNKEAFENFRAKYNETKNIEDLFILICYSFNFQIRFNNNQKYNSSFGKEASTMNDNIRSNVNKFVTAMHNKNVNFQCADFREFDFKQLQEDDVVYCDPPYLISGAVYQDGKRGFKGWNQQDDIDLYNILDELNSRNVKFALSNMLESKGNKNEYLIEWSQKYSVHNLSMNYNSANYQRKASGKDLEVLITNY
jgi:DNA adenine methylase Dam